jgi:hypothetical protein
VEIRFCDDCGKRMTEQDLAASSERQLCVVCLANTRGAQSPATAPISASKDTAVLSRRATTQSRPRQTDRIERGERIGSGQSPSVKTPLMHPGVIIAISVGVVMGIIAFMMMSGSTNDNKSGPTTVAKADSPAPKAVQPTQSSAQPSPSLATPSTPKTAPAENSSPPAPAVVRAQEPPAPNQPHELTPYELHKLQAETQPAAPAAESTPKGKEVPASDEPWKELFNGKDLDGFQVLNGDWKVEDGALTCAPADAGKKSRILTTGQFSDFELRFKFMLSKGRHSELQLHDYSQVYPLQPDNNVWKEVLVKSLGNSITVTMDGASLSPAADSDGSAKTGAIGFYAPKGVVIKIKEMSLRPIHKP